MLVTMTAYKTSHYLAIELTAGGVMGSDRHIPSAGHDFAHLLG